jgi:hypothetical protein
VARVDTSTWLGAVGGDPRNFTVSIFVPSQTRDGMLIDHAAWQLETLEIMARLFGGATVIECQGAWRDDERGGAIGIEKVSTVYSLMAESSWNKKTVTELAKFLHRMGRESDQGEVGLVVNGRYFPIREFSK